MQRQKELDLACDKVIFLEDLEMISTGVCEVYRYGRKKIIRVTDKIEAFGQVLPSHIPGKGAAVATMMDIWSEEIAERFPHIRMQCIEHDPIEEVIFCKGGVDVTSQCRVLRHLRQLPVKVFVCGYLTGAQWRAYRKRGSLFGKMLERGLRLGQKIPSIAIATMLNESGEPVMVKNTEMATHPEIGFYHARRIVEVGRDVYNFANSYALRRGFRIANAQFSFGVDEDDVLHLMSDTLTADVTFYARSSSCQIGRNMARFVSDPARACLQEMANFYQWNIRTPAPELPESVVQEVSQRYQGLASALFRTIY